MRTLTKKIRKHSKKRASQMHQYGKLRNAFLDANPICAVHGGMCRSTEVHHQKGRVGALLTDIRYFLPVCRAAHHEIEMYPEWAKKMGYSLSRLSTED